MDFESESVYSEVILDALDTFYHGLEDEHYKTPADRRRRYEARAQRFLAGEQQSILSATLRGPFEADGGWSNPWASRPQDSLQAISASQPVKPTTARSRCEEQADTQDSFESHLPSPESLKKADKESHPFLVDADVDRVRNWQRSVSADSQKSGCPKKRRAKASDWLKQPPKKRKTSVIDAEFITTPSRQSRKTLVPVSSTGRSSSFKASFNSSQLCPGDQGGDDELAANEEFSKPPRSSLATVTRLKISPSKCKSPKRALRKTTGSDPTESADELSQETTEDIQAAATLSSPVSNKDALAAATLSSPTLSSPVLTKDAPAATTPVPKKKNTGAPPPETTGSPVKRRRTPRIRKSRLKHKIAALRGPLPMPVTQEKEVEVPLPQPQIQEKEIKDTLVKDKLESQPQHREIKDTFMEGALESLPKKQMAVIQEDEEAHFESSNVRESSPLSEISSSWDSVSWHGFSSPEQNAAEATTRETSTQSDTVEKSEGGLEGNESDADPFATEDQPEAPESDDEDQHSDISSEVSDISIADAHLRASSVLRMDELMPTSEIERLDAELDFDDAASHLFEEEHPESDTGTSGYETALSRSESGEAIPQDVVEEEAAERLDAQQSEAAKSHASRADKVTRGVQQGHGIECSRKIADQEHATAEDPEAPEPSALEETTESCTLLLADDIANKTEQDASAEDESSVGEKLVPVSESTTEAERTLERAHREPNTSSSLEKQPRTVAQEPTLPSQETADSMDIDTCTGLSGVTETLRAPSPTHEASLTAPRGEQISKEAKTLEAQGDMEQVDNNSESTMDEPKSHSASIPQPSVEPILAEGLAAAPSTPPEPSTPQRPFFAPFLSPSPEHNARQRRKAQFRASLRRKSDLQGSSISSILKNPWSEPKPEKRVSFAPLPWETDNDAFLASLERADKERPASPPPNTAIEDLPTANDAEFQGHFNAMAKRSAKTTPLSQITESQTSMRSQDSDALLETNTATGQIGKPTDGQRAESPKKSLFHVLDSENQAPDEDMDDVFDDLSFALRPYDLEAELDEAKLDVNTGLADFDFGGW